MAHYSWKDSLVAICTPHNDDKGSSEWGTGIPIEGGFVLTARHILFPKGVENPGVPMIAWRGIDEKLEPKALSNGRMAIIEFGEKLDVALLKIDDLPEGARALKLNFNRNALKGKPGWETAGFNDASMRDSKRCRGDYSGTADTDAQGSQTIQFTANAPPAVVGGSAPHTGWKGISGAPVVLDSNFEIIAILKEVPDQHDNKKLVAVPVWRLKGNKDFIEAIAQPETEEIRRAFIKRLKPLLADPEALAAMAVFGIQAGMSDEERATALLDCDPKQFFDQMHPLVSGGSLDSATRSHLERILLELAPPLMHSVSRAIAGGDPLTSFHALPAATLTMAELLVAAHQRRAASFANSGAHFDHGEFLVKPAPQAGFNEDAATNNVHLIAARMSWILAQGLNPTSKLILNAVGPGFGVSKDRIDSRYSDTQKEELCRDLNVALKLAKDDLVNPEFHYVVFDLMSSCPAGRADEQRLNPDGQEIAAIDQTIGKMGELMPDLAVFCIDSGHQNRDRQQLGQFLRYLTACSKRKGI